MELLIEAVKSSPEAREHVTEILLEEKARKEYARLSGVTSLEGMKRWREVQPDVQERFLSNVFCGNCGVVRIKDYTVQLMPYGIVLEGVCSTCSRKVARVVE
ncbi:hypothetical protein MJA45_04540 [Paenibacillus aurantius]|uniref:Uncharacterized protein n=1 Tax=Paenibacillus aurantius TaxID=2918900 RepID=A0AA96LEM1_9BACL|nr:hypothetical protein [Paenibacillus aurantius]WNQ12321.1 hypothetical protein MJA45_04540 [Paenibacillus aurantius]